jgi:hypothetical protein
LNPIFFMILQVSIMIVDAVGVLDQFRYVAWTDSVCLEPRDVLNVVWRQAVEQRADINDDIIADRQQAHPLTASHGRDGNAKKLWAPRRDLASSRST